MAVYCLERSATDALLLVLPVGRKQDLSDNQFDSAVGFDEGMAALASLPTLQARLWSVQAHCKHVRLSLGQRPVDLWALAASLLVLTPHNPLSPCLCSACACAPASCPRCRCRYAT